MAAEIEPDIILLDVSAAGRGLRVLEELLTGDETCWIPVVMLGRRDQLPSIDDALNLGAQDFLVKPLGIGGLGRFLTDRITGVPSMSPGNRPVVEWTTP